MKEYFSHDYNARNDQKLVSLIRKMGMEGIGIYWCLVEIMYECYGSIHPDKIIDIAFDLHTDSDKVKAVLDSDLFKKKSKKYFSTSILNRIEKRKEKTDKTRLAALKSWESRRKPNANAKQTESKSNAIILKDIKVNNIKENKSIEERIKEFEIQILTINSNENILPVVEIQKFISYWTEYGERSKKFRQEKETTWDTKRRLERWKLNIKTNGQDKRNNEPIKATVQRDYSQTPDEAIAELKAEQKREREARRN